MSVYLVIAFEHEACGCTTFLIGWTPPLPAVAKYLTKPPFVATIDTESRVISILIAFLETDIVLHFEYDVCEVKSWLGN